MRTTQALLGGLTLAEVIRDLETGRSRPPRPAGRLSSLTSQRRPTLGGPAFLRAYLTAKALGRVHPRLARRALLRLWFTPWVHPSTRRPVTEFADDVVAWSLPFGDVTLRGYTGGDGPTAVLVHGWAGRAADLRHVALDLVGAGWRVVAPDLPAHGLTAGARTDVFELRDALTAVLDHERPTAIVAHSLGFPVTMLAFDAGAPTPDRLVALAPGRRMRDALDRFAARARLGPALTDELRGALEARLGADVWQVLDVDRGVGDLDISGLVVHDADDDEVALADGEQIVARWRGARFVATSGLGHRRILRDEVVRRLVVDALRPAPAGPGASGR